MGVPASSLVQLLRGPAGAASAAAPARLLLPLPLQLRCHCKHCHTRLHRRGREVAPPLLTNTAGMADASSPEEWPKGGGGALCRDLDGAVRCPICGEAFETPLSLRCGHACECGVASPPC